jgi:hypothetical protein
MPPGGKWLWIPIRERAMARLILGLFLVMAAACACAQAPGVTQPQPEEAPDAPATVFPHSESSRFWISGQFNAITQGHPSFPALYSGPNSLRNAAETQNSRTFTLYTGVELTRTTEILFDLESAGGRGIGDALGLAGFTNLDVVRNPALGAKPYLARFLIHQIVPLGKASEEAERNPLSLFTKLPARRLEIRFGKFSLADFLDQNSIASDSHTQFMNWTVDNNGAWDYAADTRGYTEGLYLEFHDRGWSARFAETLMPKVANGIDLDYNLRRSRSENYELEFRPRVVSQRKTTLRLLSFANHANMGDYERAVADFLAGRTPVPDVIATRQPGTVKYGFGLNGEQEITKDIGIFTRLGWNEGRHESFAYTEVDQTISFGGAAQGEWWRRKQDKAGLAFVSNAISRAHRQYLKLGGQGFLLGDGTLNYGRESILESYYTLHIWRGISLGPDLQYIVNPGYNRDRGPVLAPALRVHVEM